MILFAIPFLLVFSTVFAMENSALDFNAADILTIREVNNENSATYVASLTNGDVVQAYFFTTGPLKNTIKVLRRVYDMYGRMFMQYSLSERYYYLLKKMGGKRDNFEV